MKIVRICYMIALSCILFLSSTNNASPGAVATSVEEYYKDQLPITDIGVIASDWDQVITDKPGWLRRYTGIAKAATPMLWGAIKLCFNVEALNDMKKAINRQLYNPNTGYKIHGAGKYIQFFANKYDPQIVTIKQRLMDAINVVTPIYSTCALYAQLKLPLVIWTNNDYESYNAKLINLNKYAQEGIKGIPMQPLAVFVAGANSELSEEQQSCKGKPSREYYKKAYAYTKQVLNLSDSAYVIFVDDLAENVHVARQVAKKHNLPIIAIQYTTAGQLEYDFNRVMGKEQLPVIDVPAEQEPICIDPKELDEYLFNRDERFTEFEQ